MSISASLPTTPCVKICVMDPLSGHCIGCGRTIAEISLWSEMSLREREAVISGLAPRMAAARSRAARRSRIGGRERRP